MMRYESTIIINPNVLDKDLEDLKKKILAFIKKNDGKIVHIDDWGMKDLAYPIQKFTRGSYYILDISTSNGNLIDKLEIQYKREENIIRFLTVALDQHGVTYLENRRKYLSNKTEEETIDA